MRFRWPCALDGRAALVAPSAKSRNERTPVLDEDRAEDVVLRGEVVVEEPVRDTRVFGDVADPRAVVAVLGEHANGSVQDPRALVRLGD